MEENCNGDKAEDDPRTSARISHDRVRSKDLVDTSAADGCESRSVAVGDSRGGPKLIARTCGTNILIKKLAASAQDLNAIRTDRRKTISQPDQPHH